MGQVKTLYLCTKGSYDTYTVVCACYTSAEVVKVQEALGKADWNPPEPLCFNPDIEQLRLPGWLVRVKRDYEVIEVVAWDKADFDLRNPFTGYQTSPLGAQAKATAIDVFAADEEQAKEKAKDMLQKYINDGRWPE